MLAALQQSYLRQLTSIASGGGGSGDVFTPAVDKAIQQGYQAEAEG